jgi:hypothetical protein
MEGDVTPLVQMFEASEEATRQARKLSERDRDYYDGKQWTSKEEEALKKRKQPIVTYNRIQRKIDYLSGLEKQQRKDPKAFPRNPQDEKAADAATDAIRFVCDDVKWDDKRSAAWDDILVPGTCAVMVGHKDGKNGPDPDIIQIPWDRFFYDPHSAKPDFSDARHMGIVTWYDVEDAEAKWPDKKELLNSTLASDTQSDTYDDKPKDKMWADAKRKRVRVVEIYYLKGRVWNRCVITRAGHLEDPQPSPYMDEDGKPENPIKAMSLYVDRDNNRYGAVRVLISPQDEINKRRSKGLHLITMRQVRVSHGAGITAEGKSDPGAIRNELAKPDGVLVGDKDEIEILPTSDMARGNFEMLMDAKAEIDLLGANAALAGKNENDLSGRAILAQQQGGMVEVARMFDRLRSLSIEVYRSVWNRVRQFWTDERWVRITDNDNNLRFVGLNQQVTVAQLAQEVAQGDESAMKTASQLVGPQLLQAAMQGDPQAQTALGMFVQQHGHQVVETRNAVNELDVDIVIDEGMDTPTVQAEQFDTLVKMLPGLGPIGQSPEVLKLLIEASSLRNKEKLVEILEQGPSPEQQQMQQQAQQVQMAGAVAQVEEVQSKAELNKAKAQQAAAPAEPQSVDPIDAARLHLDGTQTQIDGYRAETERMEALKPEPPKQQAA